jgi:hypothetical protein
MWVRRPACRRRRPWAAPRRRAVAELDIEVRVAQFRHDCGCGAGGGTGGCPHPLEVLDGLQLIDDLDGSKAE